MDEHQIAFILSVNNLPEAEECLRYIKRLMIPEGYEIDIITIQEAPSMAAAYDAGMKSSKAKYKIYLHQDVFLIYSNILTDMIAIFQSNQEIGIMGCIGSSSLPENAVAGMAWDTGKLLQNQVPKKAEYPWVTEKAYAEVDVVDGLFMATQYDIDWRKDIFDGWDFYDLSQCCEMKRRNYKVVVPHQEKIWCYHDNLYSRMLDFDRSRMKFIQEYQDIKNLSMDADDIIRKNQSYEQMKIELIEQMGELLDKGEMEYLAEIFRVPQNRGYLFLREYEMISRIHQAETAAGEAGTVWRQGGNERMSLELIRRLKHLLKAVEYDAEEKNTIAEIKHNYSQSAVILMMEEYCIYKDKVKERIFSNTGETCESDRRTDGI